MIAIIDNGKCYSANAIYFVDVPSAEAAEALAQYLRVIDYDDEAHVIGVSSGIEWARRPEDNATIDEIVRDSVGDIEWARDANAAMVAAEALVPCVGAETAEAIRRERRLMDAAKAKRSA